MTAIDESLGDKLTMKQLERALSRGLSPIVEVESMDGVYTVRFHHAGGVSYLADADGRVRTFMGTGEISDLMGGAGIKHGVLTWSDQCGDEMIGVPGKAMSPEDMLAYGTRIGFR